MDLKEINEVLEMYQDEMGWKISTLTDQYEHQRKQAAKAKAALQAKSAEFNPNVNNASVINNARMKQNTTVQDQLALQTYESAQAEIELLVAHLQRYMMTTAINLFSRESASLIKA